MALLIIILSANSSLAQDLTSPVIWRDTSPLAGLFGEPLPVVDTRHPGWSQSLRIQVSNSFTHRTRPAENLSFDGETEATELTFQRNFRNTVFSVTLPFIRHHGGYLDRLIDTYHGLTSLPDRGRSDAAYGEVMFEWRDENPLILLNTETSGPGDLRLQASQQLRNDPRDHAGFFLKLPTGQASDLTGSGAVDLGVFIQSERQMNFLGKRPTLHVLGGVTLLGRGDLTPERQDRVRWLGRTTLAFPLGPRSSIAAHVELASPLYQSALRAARGQTGVGGLVLRRRWSQHLVEVGFHEDILPGSAADFSVSLRFSRLSLKHDSVI
ncbi:MAG: DUF3187 family protein [Pseudomonadota bacterium]